MQELNDAVEHMESLPFLPGISVLVIVVGVVLVFGRHMLGLVTQWVGPANIRSTIGHRAIWPDFRLSVDEKVSLRSQQTAGGPFLTTLWFGLLAGWLELGLFLARRAVDPRLSIDMLRTNRHFVWMIPVSDALIFGVVGVLMAVLVRFRRGFALWIALRLSIGLSVLTVLLTVEGLYTTAGVSMACGLASVIAPWLEHRAAGLGRLVRASFPAMAVSLAVLTGLTYGWITSAEHRALSLRPPIRPGAPNVLLIVLDNVRAGSLSLYGHKCPTAPNIQRLARKGIVFSEARATAPWTLPSHASMMTGRWPHELSAGWNTPLDETFPTLAEALGRQGYATAGFVGNVFYCNTLYGIGRGFARYEDAYENLDVSLFETVRSSGLGKRIVQACGYPIRLDDATSVRKTAAMLNRDVLGWIGRQRNAQPFFVFINYYDAHRPYVLPPDAEQRFGLASLPIEEQAKIEKRFLDLAARKSAPADLTHQQIANDGFNLYRHGYHSCIAYLDRQVGLLLDELERRRLLENTLVILTSDHGEQLGEHGLIAHGVSLYRQEVHVPLLIIPPSGVSTAKTVDDPVSLREIPATVAEWVGLGPQNPFPGRSLTRFMSDGMERPTPTSPVLSEVERNEFLPQMPQITAASGPLRSLVTQDQVYIRGDDGREELYDRVHDELEAVDLVKYPQSRPFLDRFREEINRLCP